MAAALIDARREVDPYLAISNLDRERRRVVGEEVEGAAAGEIEARVVPVAGEDPVTHRPAIEREPHVRAPIVHGIHGIAGSKQREVVAIHAGGQAAALLEVGQARGAHEGLGGHANFPCLGGPRSAAACIR